MKKVLFFLLLINILLTSSACANDPFCNSEVLVSQTFYEDTLVLALYTHKPIVPGHCLVIPKRHAQRFEKLSEAEILQIGRTLKKVDLAVKKVFGTSDYLILEKNGKAAYQTVPHVHFHYIPKKADDNSILLFFFNAIMAQLRGPISTEKMQETTEKLSRAIYTEN